MVIEARMTTWAEREPDVFLARRKQDRDRRQGDRRQGDRRQGDRHQGERRRSPGGLVTTAPVPMTGR